MKAVTEPPPDFYDEVGRRGSHFRERAFEFDKLAVSYSQKGYEVGALFAALQRDHH
jgi:hypothetical protein